MKAVYRMNQIKNLYCLLGLICLKMADKMPGNLSVQGFVFLLGFLNTVLTNICNTSINSLTHSMYIVIFGNSYQQYIILTIFRPVFHTGGNLRFYFMELFFYHVYHSLCSYTIYFTLIMAAMRPVLPLSAR